MARPISSAATAAPHSAAAQARPPDDPFAAFAQPWQDWLAQMQDAAQAGPLQGWSSLLGGALPGAWLGPWAEEWTRGAELVNANLARGFESLQEWQSQLLHGQAMLANGMVDAVERSLHANGGNGAAAPLALCEAAQTAFDAMLRPWTSLIQGAAQPRG